MRNVDAASSLMIIVSSPAVSQEYSDFKKIVNYYNEAPPFNFPNPFGLEKDVSVGCFIIIESSYRVSQHKKASNHHANLPLEMYSFTL